MTPGNPGFQVLTAGTALGCGLAAGVFFAFSSFVMSGLDRLPAGEAIAAMQSINVTAVRPLFMTALFGTAAACIPLIVIGFRHRQERVGVLLLIGAGLYLLGTIGLTMGYHVPRNDALALLDPKRPDSAAAWHDYVVAWTRANHVRSVAALGAAAAFTAALMKG
jgi:uncharacterized membrane protein